MKRGIAIGIVLALAVPLCMAQLWTKQITPVARSAAASRWVEIGNLSTAQAYPAVTARDYTSVSALADAATIVWDMSNEPQRKRQLSFQTTADADSTTIALLGFADRNSTTPTGANTNDDRAVYLGQIVLTGGTQTGQHSNVYVDTAVATDACWYFDVCDSGNDRRCVINIASNQGYKLVYIVATTLAGGSTLYAEARCAD